MHLLRWRGTPTFSFVVHSYRPLMFCGRISISGGWAKTLMIVHISPEADVLGETISTLKFAERVATVELDAARANKDNTDVKALKEQVFPFSLF